ncbi:DUF7151 family protein [Seongchinamella sediminis]|uniref:DUF7151 family protein n=1 Tax=Seongchinamella sediminis TaxID=2283635 RepID=UPI00196868B3|nr:c-type cytochrome [Seongchinamella sediminis]
MSKNKLRITTALTGLFTVSILLGGCEPDDGDNGRAGIDGMNGIDGIDSLVSQTVLPSGDFRCGVGGVLLESGPDSNRNGILDRNEVIAASAVCDGNPIDILDPAMVHQGREIFRYDTFGNEQLWTETLVLHQVIESSVSPRTALSVGLKVDAEVLPPGILDSVDLDDPATTVALVGMNAVVGIQGLVEEIEGESRLTRLGITCALCHSDVDDSVAPGIGKRLDGWPNRDINPGLILSLSPALQDPDTQSVLTSWGPGKYDAYWNHDGLNNPAVIPPAYGLNGVHRTTFTGEGDIRYWNAYVAITQMGGQGNFRDDALGIDIRVEDDQVTPRLAALKAYQFSLDPPRPPRGSFDPVAAGRGKSIFEGAGRCVSCHTGTAFTDANSRLHDPSAVGTDPTLASRSTTGQYRTTPLRGAWQHPPYFHDGSAATFDEVVAHYDLYLGLGLTADQRADLVEYLKSL